MRLEEVSNWALRVLTAMWENSPVLVQVEPSPESGCASVMITGNGTLETRGLPCPEGMCLSEWAKVVAHLFENELLRLTKRSHSVSKATVDEYGKWTISAKFSQGPHAQ